MSGTLRSKAAGALFFLLALREVAKTGGRIYFFQLFWAFRLGVVGIFFFQRDPPQKQSGAWVSGFSLFSTFLPLAYVPGVARRMPQTELLAFVGLLLAGSLLSLWGVVSLGRSFGISPAVRTIVSEGPYSLLKHPIYFGYALSECALVALAPNRTNFSILTVSLACYVARGVMESRMLAA